MLKSYLKSFYIFVLLALSEPKAFAGSQQFISENFFPSERISAFAKKVEKYAAKKRAQVFFIARVGIPKSALPEGIEFTHVGMGVYSRIQTSDGKEVPGYVIYNLYQKESDMGSSHLVTDYPFDFFLGARELKAGLIIPVPKLQKKLLESLALKRNETLHNPQYSTISNPFSSKFQNCTEHILDMIFASIYNTDSLELIKANQRRYFKPKSLQLSPFKKLFAPMLSRSIKLSDHHGGVSLATFTTIASFLEEHNLALDRAILVEG